MVMLSFLLFDIVGRVSPGPNNIMVLSSGANYGFKRTIPHIMGIAIGYGFLLLLLSFGFEKIFNLYPLLYDSLKYIGGTYLLYLAYKISKSPTISVSVEKGEQDGKGPFSFYQAALFQLVNPKAWMIGMMVFSIFIDKNTAFFLQVFVIIGISMVTAFLGSSLWTLFGMKMRLFLSNPKKGKVFNHLMAVLVVVSFFISLF